MIAHLRGTLLAKHPNQAVVETGGIGYDVTISVPTFSDLPGLGSNVALHIHTHVREDVIALYGFLRPEEKQLFEKLITVSGIGPKLAITILSGMAADDMVKAIRGNDVVRLTRIPGIGKKTAERMVLELRDKLPPAGAEALTAIPTLSAVEEDVLSALQNLGYQRANAEKAVVAVSKNGKGGAFTPCFAKLLRCSRNDAAAQFPTNLKYRSRSVWQVRAICLIFSQASFWLGFVVRPFTHLFPFCKKSLHLQMIENCLAIRIDAAQAGKISLVTGGNHTI